MQKQTFILNNTTGALIPSQAINTMLLNKGKYYGEARVERSFIAAEVGVGVGQTRDATANSYGFLFCQFQGYDVQTFSELDLFQNSTVGAATVIKTLPLAPNLKVTIVKSKSAPVDQGYVRGVCSVYLFDLGAQAGNQIVAPANGLSNSVGITFYLGNQ